MKNFRILITIIFIFTLFTLGCTDSNSPTSDPIQQNSDNPADDYNPASPVATETHSSSTTKNNDDLIYCSIFNIYFNGTKSDVDNEGNYHVVDENNQVIFEHHEIKQTYYQNDLTPIQEQIIHDKYGLITITMFEKIDTNGDGNLDQVGLKFKTRDENYHHGSFYYVHDYIEKCDPNDYLSLYIAEEFGVPWWMGDDSYKETTVSTLFGTDVYGIKYSSTNSYYIYDKFYREYFLTHVEYSSFDPYDDFQPEQARELEDRYGSAKSVVMEQVDTDSDGQLDKVAVKYVGSKGTLEFEMDIMKNANGRILNVGPESYIWAYMFL